MNSFLSILTFFLLFSNYYSLEVQQNSIATSLENLCILKAGNIDLSTLTQTYPNGVDYSYSTPDYNYYLNICANSLNNPGKGKTASSPLIFCNEATTCTQYGQLNTAIWNDNYVEYSGGDACTIPNASPNATLSLRINFIPGLTQGEIVSISSFHCMFSVVFSTNLIPMNQFCHDTNGIDYSPLTSSSDYQFKLGGQLFSMNICSKVSNPCASDMNSPLVISSSPSNTCISLGNLNTASWNSNMVSYSNGDICPASKSNSTYSSSITFLCNKAATTAYIYYVKTLSYDPCSYEVFVNSNLACGYDN